MTILANRRPIRNLEDLPDWSLRSELAEYLQLAEQTLANYAVQGIGPKVTKLGNSRFVRYRKSDVIAFLEASAAL